MRLSDAERVQIADAAGRASLTVSGFIRRAALQASAVALGKVAVKAPVHEVSERQPGLAVVEAARSAVVDEPWRPHHFVDGECLSCGLDVNDSQGRDLSCGLVVA